MSLRAPRAVARLARAARHPVARPPPPPPARGDGLALAALAAAAGAWGSRQVQLEERVYQPPPRLDASFSTLQGAPKDQVRRLKTDTKGQQLALAVKDLDVDRVRSILQKWPRGATLLDRDDNTLFHLAATQSERYGARPDDAREVLQMLFAHGWEVVDLKNTESERAELVAAKVNPEGLVRRMLADRSRSFVEPQRYAAPVALVGEGGPTPWAWSYLVADDKRRSWAGALPRAIPEARCRAWMKTATESAPWEALPDTPRKVVWFVSPEYADTPYRYSGLEYKATVYPPWMEEIRAEVCAMCGIPPEEYPNSCNVNIYDDHRSEVGWHSDDEVMFQSLSSDTRIISFSLGSARDFCWRLQGTTETLGCIPLGDGDIMTMEGLFQKHYKHSVPVSATPSGPRINFTFRWIRVKAHAPDAETKALGS